MSDITNANANKIFVRLTEYWRKVVDGISGNTLRRNGDWSVNQTPPPLTGSIRAVACVVACKKR